MAARGRDGDKLALARRTYNVRRANFSLILEYFQGLLRKRFSGGGEEDAASSSATLNCHGLKFPLNSNKSPAKEVYCLSLSMVPEGSALQSLRPRSHW